MQEQPPQPLLETLRRLRLATPRQVHAVRGRVRRLARDLPLLECVWVDALAQARLLTPLQAAEINAGRADGLQVGPYLLLERLHEPGIGARFLARPSDGNHAVQLLTLPAGADAEPLQERLQALIDDLRGYDGCVAAPRRAGSAGGRLWISADHHFGQTAAQWMVQFGRFPATTVLEIARQMIAGLAAFAATGHVHGDVRAHTLLLRPGGRVALTIGGIRGLVRPQEGFAHADLPPEAFDGLAPERVADGTPPTVASDLYACGCLWWHLLTGRQPQSGGNAQTKLLAVQSGRIDEVLHLAPGTPPLLAEVIAACTSIDPDDRPESFAELAARLGAPTPRGRRALAHCLGAQAQPRIRLGNAPEAPPTAGRSLRSWAAAATVAAVVGAATWPLWRGSMPGSSVASAAPAVVETATTAAAEPDHENPAPIETEPPAPAPDVLLLPVDTPVRWQDITLRDGITIRGDAGRPLVLVSGGGLPIMHRDVRFEQVDFLWKDDAKPQEDHVSRQAPAIVALRAEGARFTGCTFQAPPGTGTPVGFNWQTDSAGDAPGLNLPLAVMEFQDCVFQGLTAAIDCHVAGALAVRMHNCLHLGPGPLLRMHRCPLPDEPLTLHLSRCTLRGCQSVLSCRYDEVGRPGRLVLRADGSVFVPSGLGALLLLVGSEPPTELLAACEWSGRGSVLESQAAVARWDDGSGRLLMLNEADLTMTGLVRSWLEFADPDGGQAASSQLTRWSVPLRSTDPPGVGPGLPTTRLPSPR